MAKVSDRVRPLGSREYKAMLEVEGFDDDAVRRLWTQMRAAAATVGVSLPDRIKRKKNSREISFLDTPDRRLWAGNRALRVRRRRRGKTERWVVQITLKCRVPDRYEAAAADLAPADPFPEPLLNQRNKLEEDIALPFAARPSQSTTVEVLEEAVPEGMNLATLADAVARFPGLGPLAVGHEDAPLVPVRGAVVETLWASAEFALTQTFTDATAAIIIWSPKEAPDRPAVAEVSFRYGSKKEAYDGQVAATARRLFEAIGRMKCVDPEAKTKTGWIYSG